MNTLLRKPLCFTLALVLISTQLIHAQQPGSSAPVPPQIASAQNIFVANGGGSDIFNAYTDGPTRAYNEVYAALQKWNHYKIVSAPSAADLIFEISALAPSTQVVDSHGTTSTVYNPELRLRILDAKTNAVLWTLTSDIRPGGFQNSRDSKFDKAVVILVNQVRQLAGEQLTPSEIKDTRSSSRQPTSTKVIFGVAIAAAAATLIVIVYHITHQKTPTLPTIPPCTNPPFCPVT